MARTHGGERSKITRQQRAISPCWLDRYHTSSIIFSFFPKDLLSWLPLSKNGRTVSPEEGFLWLGFGSQNLTSRSLCTADWFPEKLFIVTSDGRTIVGTLLGNDQVQNLILSDAIERVYSNDADVEEVPLGLYLIRGDNLCLVGEYDETKLNDDQRVDEPIKPVLQHIYFWSRKKRKRGGY